MHNRLKTVRENLYDEKGKKYSQTKLAEDMSVTRDMVATYESGRVEPSPLYIKTFCEKYNINEQWLKTGVGEMLNPITREAEIALIVNEMLKGEPDDIRVRLVKILYSLNPEQLELLRDIGNQIKNSPL